jgi:hypothetical protein
MMNNSIETININEVKNNNNDISQSKFPLKNFADERKKSFTKPTIIRLEYKTRFNSAKGPNVAYCLINKSFVEPSVVCQGSKEFMKEIIEKYSLLCTVVTANRPTFEIYVMAGESVRPYERYAHQIITCLQNWFKLLLKTIVIDFIKDERGIIYFLGVKAMTLVKDIPKINEIPLGRINLTNVNDENNIRKFYKTWTCRLCQLPYPKAKITKMVTFKLLMKLKDNLAKRGFSIFSHVHNNIYNESLSCRVCDLCYKLLITEQELMEIQKTIALCNNIDVQSEEELALRKKSPSNLMKVPNNFKTLSQWRVLFYFVRFYMFDWKKFKFDEKTNYKLYIKIFDQLVGIPIFAEMKKFISSDEVEINLSKIFYFFSNEYTNLKQILKNEEIDFRIVINDDWRNPIAQCQTMCLSFYDEGIKGKPMRVKNTLNFFSSEVKHFKCQAYIGLNNDGDVLVENFHLYGYKFPNPVFLTDLDYYSFHPLPNDWYELFAPQESEIEQEERNKNKESFLDIEEMIDKIIYELELNDSRKKKKEKYNNI